MASEEELLVKITLKDDLTRDAAAAKKSVNELAKAVEAARKEVEAGGDPAALKQLQQEFDEAKMRSAQLQRQVKLTADEIRDLERAAKKTGDTTKKQAGLMQTAWSKLQKVMQNPLVTAVSVGAITLFAKSAIQSFSEVQDSTDALVATFGDSGEALVRWANESALAFNLSKKEALSASQTFAIFAKAAGLSGQELETFSIDLTARAAEVASYFGGTTKDAIEAFGSALRGEFNPIEKYGVLLNDATMRIKAMEMGLIETTSKALTPQQKVLVGYAAILEQTSDAQGDVARTSDSMANQIKQGQAQMENFKSTVGETLAVALAPILKTLNGLMGVFNGLGQPIKTVTIAIGALGVAALVVGPRIAAMVASMKAAGVTATGMTSKMKGAAMFLGGPWGAALAVGTIALTHFLMEQAAANARVDEFTDSIDAATGKLNQAGVAGVAKQLLTDISQEDWDRLAGAGFSVEEVTAAIVAGGPAWDAMYARLRDYAQGLNEYSGLAATAANNADALNDDVRRSETAYLVAGRSQDIAARASAELAERTDDLTLSQGKAVNMIRDMGRILPPSTYKVSDYYVAISNAKRATDGLVQSLSDLSAAVSEWGAKDNFKESLKQYLEKPTADAARTMITNMENAASAIEDPGKRAEFTISAIGKIEEAFQSSGLKVPKSVRDALNDTEAAALEVKAAVDKIKASIDAIPDSKTVRFIIETTGRAPSSVTYNAHGGYIGGTTGGPTSDTVPAMLSRGEYVLRGGAVAALRAAIGDAGMYALNHADRTMPSFLDSPVPAIAPGGREPALVGAGAPVINIGEIKADSGVDVQTEVMWALRRADRIKRERG